MQSKLCENGMYILMRRFFLGRVSKRDVLSAFGAHIFFDDKHVHADPASEVVPSAVVQYREGDNPEK